MVTGRGADPLDTNDRDGGRGVPDGQFTASFRSVAMNDSVPSIPI